jgi:hypothetical protein
MLKTFIHQNDPTLKERIARIERLDLEPIMVKLMEEEAWSLEQCMTTAQWYKRYLILNLLYPEKSIVPSQPIDTFWHFHILDTMKYQKDCETAFGYFLHHFPYFGLRGADDARESARAFGETKDLFLFEFGESADSLNGLFMSAAECHGGGCNAAAGCHSSCNAAATCSNPSSELARPTLFM